MFKKKKSTEKPNLPKEYVWELDVEGQTREFKCLVTEDGVTTYQDGVEHKHLKITDPTCMEGVLQIDCETKIFDEMIPFQLERFIPYIKLDDHYIMSDTTREDRMQQQIAIYKNQSKEEAVVGAIMLAVMLVIWVVKGSMGDWWMLSVFGIFFLSSAAYRMVRLRNELNALEEAKAEAEAHEAEMSAYLEDKTPQFHKTGEE